MPTSLPYREELFAHEVAAFTPPDRAYLLAGFKSRPEFARANACRLLRKVSVTARIVKRLRCRKCGSRSVLATRKPATRPQRAS